MEYTVQLCNLVVMKGTLLASVMQKLQELVNTSISAHLDESGSRQNDFARKQAITLLVERCFPALSLKLKSMLDDNSATCSDMLGELQNSRDASLTAKAHTTPLLLLSAW